MITFNKIKEKDIHRYAILAKIDNKYYEISKEMDKFIIEGFYSTKIVLHTFNKDNRHIFYILKNVIMDCNLPFRIYKFNKIIEDNLPDIYTSYFISLTENQ